VEFHFSFDGNPWKKGSNTPWNSIEFYSLFQWISMEYNGKFRDGHLTLFKLKPVIITKIYTNIAQGQNLALLL